MPSIFRSEKMAKCQIFLQLDAAYASVAELGELGLLQFCDLNPDVSSFQRKFVNEVRRCDEMERRLRFLEKEINKENIHISNENCNPETPSIREMIAIEEKLERIHHEIENITNSQEKLNSSFIELTELKHVLSTTKRFFREGESDGGRTSLPSLSFQNPNYDSDNGSYDYDSIIRVHLQITFVAGVIMREKEAAFDLLLWRACRGNVFMKKEEIKETLLDPVSGDVVSKSVFVIFFQGENLKAMVKKICQGFHATLYPCPTSRKQRKDVLNGVRARLIDLTSVIHRTRGI